MPRTALVTGAARGIGLAIAERLAADGHDVIALDRSVPDVHPEWSWHAGDLADREQVASFVAAVQARGPVDVLVNSAGINRQKDDGARFELPEVTDTGWDLTIAVNLTAPFLLMRAFVPGMRERGWGRVVNIASRAGRTFVPASNVDYSATKAGLIGLSRMVAGESAADGVTVNCVAPGRISTPLADSQAADILEESLRAIPARRVGDADEIAAAVAWYASDGAAYTTGTTLDVNGGAFIA
jgi:3-oxoacyl-[acyl-carrier protein] reductase